jgi:hypothetical protein
MSWVLDGQKVKAKYLGETVTGVVTDSRVKYGGKVQYTVELDSPVQFRWRSEPTDRVLVDRDELLLENN